MNIQLRSAVAVAAIGALAGGTAAFAAGPCVSSISTAIGAPGIDDSSVNDLRYYDDGTALNLYAVGNFLSAGGGVPGTENLAVWNGSAWGSVGGGLSGGQFTNALEIFQNELYVGGYFNAAGGVAGTAKLAKWNGTAWSSVDAQLDAFTNSVWNLLTWDDGNGPALYIAGNFQAIGGTTGHDHIVKFDGTDFTLIGGGTIGAPGLPPIVIGLGVYDDGDGEDLYISGRFTSMAGVPASRIAKWDGTSWSEPGGGLSGAGAAPAAYAMKVFEGSLYVGGQAITMAGGVPVANVARWDGTSWHAVGAGFNGTVWDLQVFDDGSGPALHAFGTFTLSGATVVNHVAKLEGGAWVPATVGVDANTYVGAVLDIGGQQSLQIGGGFTTVNGTLSANRMVTVEGCPITGGCAADLASEGGEETDGIVNLFDLLELLANWGTAGPGADLAEPTDVVNLFDLLELLAAWGPC